MRDFGGVISFELKGGVDEARAFASSVRLWTLAESLGSVKSLLCHPATMTHASVEPEVRRENGISDGLIRLSVGIEDVRDLRADLEEALARPAGAALGVLVHAAVRRREDSRHRARACRRCRSCPSMRARSNVPPGPIRYTATLR